MCRPHCPLWLALPLLLSCPRADSSKRRAARGCCSVLHPMAHPAVSCRCSAGSDHWEPRGRAPLPPLHGVPEGGAFCLRGGPGGLRLGDDGRALLVGVSTAHSGFILLFLPITGAVLEQLSPPFCRRGGEVAVRPGWFSSPLFATVRNITFVLGAHEIFQPEQSQQVRGVLRYDPDTLTNDIMLLKARQPGGQGRAGGSGAKQSIAPRAPCANQHFCGVGPPGRAVFAELCIPPALPSFLRPLCSQPSSLAADSEGQAQQIRPHHCAAQNQQLPPDGLLVHHSRMGPD